MKRQENGIILRCRIRKVFAHSPGITNNKFLRDLGHMDDGTNRCGYIKTHYLLPSSFQGQVFFLCIEHCHVLGEIVNLQTYVARQSSSCDNRS